MTEVCGDGDLAGRVRERLGPRHRVVVAAEVTAAGVALAATGADLESDVEIGSISKGVTGLLYVDARERGEVTETATLGEFLDLGDSPVAATPLAALSTHTSGLPRLPAAMHPLTRTWQLHRHGTNPYGDDLATLLDQTRRTRLGRPRPRYSNLGFELLGHAVATAAGTTYDRLLADRLVSPLGLTATYAPATAADLSTHAVPGLTRGGREVEPWTGVALAPAGGVRSSITDLARLVGALLDGSSPGVGALDPVRAFVGHARIGAAWLTLSVRGRDVTWHDGGTGGFRSWLGLDREAGVGVVLVSASTRSVDRAGFDLLRELALLSPG